LWEITKSENIRTKGHWYESTDKRVFGQRIATENKNGSRRKKTWLDTSNP